jgi:hypothetical protein
MSEIFTGAEVEERDGVALLVGQGFAQFEDVVDLRRELGDLAVEPRQAHVEVAEVLDPLAEVADGDVAIDVAGGDLVEPALQGGVGFLEQLHLGGERVDFLFQRRHQGPALGVDRRAEALLELGIEPGERDLSEVIVLAAGEVRLQPRPRRLGLVLHHLQDGQTGLDDGVPVLGLDRIAAAFAAQRPQALGQGGGGEQRYVGHATPVLVNLATPCLRLARFASSTSEA